jgi:hypothetical protein
MLLVACVCSRVLAVSLPRPWLTRPDGSTLTLHFHFHTSTHTHTTTSYSVKGLGRPVLLDQEAFDVEVDRGFVVSWVPSCACILPVPNQVAHPSHRSS